MKKKFLFVSLLAVSMNSLSDSSVVADLREIDRLHQYDPLIRFEEREKRIEAIKTRAEPIVRREFAKLADGETPPLVRDLLGDSQTLGYCCGVLHKLFETYPVDTQTRVLEKVFDVTPDSLRGNIIQSFMLDLPKESFSGKEIQQWLVKKLNDGNLWGPCYFILTDASASAVSKTATESMKRFSKKRRQDDNAFSLMSAVFLAARGDEGAVKFLDSLLDQRDIKSEVAPSIFLAAMSGNEKLIRKVRDIVITDKRTRFMGEDCIPSKISFAHDAAVACALTIEGFPPVDPLDEYDEEIKATVHQWIKSNPTYKIKLNDPRIFFKEIFKFPFIRSN